MQTFVFGLYALIMSFVALLGLFFLHLTYLALKAWYAKKTTPALPPLDASASDLPNVTIQLPVYNEQYVVADLIDAVARISYPSTALEIQVLDDSTDETTAIIQEKVAHWQGQGLSIHHIHRKNRAGYKAGALATGLKEATGEYIAIFDADFRPESDFLLRILPYFSTDKIGMVQARWEHLNTNYSVLTQLQSFILDAIFFVEKVGRDAKHYFMKFHGTAGVWRKTCIADAGGWHHDSLTEDVDLALRAQLNGWTFRYVPDLAAPAELPVTIAAFKTQQFRWTKGHFQTSRKIAGTLARANLPFAHKAHAFFLLLFSIVHILILTALLLSIPIVWYVSQGSDYTIYFQFLSFTIINILAISLFYFYGMLRRHRRVLPAAYHFIKLFIATLTISLGLSLQNSIATLQGIVGKDTPFVRTPKFNITSATGTWRDKKYRARKLSAITYSELALGLLFVATSIFAISQEIYEVLPFHILASIGFLTISLYSIFHAR